MPQDDYKYCKTSNLLTSKLIQSSKVLIKQLNSTYYNTSSIHTVLSIGLKDVRKQNLDETEHTIQKRLKK